MRQINKVAVLGAGVMGATIAAHLANAGIEVLLLDIVPKEPNDAEKGGGPDPERSGGAEPDRRAGLEGLQEDEAGAVLPAGLCGVHRGRAISRTTWRSSGSATG